MTGDDLKRLQDNFFATSKQIILEGTSLRPVGFVVTLQKHVDQLFDSGYGIEFLDPKTAILRDAQDDAVATLIVDLVMDYRRLYHAVLTVFPKTRDLLPRLLVLGQAASVDDPYMRLMRPFLENTGLDAKDVAAAVMRQICDKVDAFASIMHSEAWKRHTASPEDMEKLREFAKTHSLGEDQKSVEIVVSAMETYDFTRMLTAPIHREPSKDPKRRDAGKVLGFGETDDSVAEQDGKNVIEGRMARFLKPLPVAS
jgi:hypothetical protein